MAMATLCDLCEIETKKTAACFSLFSAMPDQDICVQNTCVDCLGWAVIGTFEEGGLVLGIVEIANWLTADKEMEEG